MHDKIVAMASHVPTPRRLPKNYRLIFDVVKASGPGVHLTTHDVFEKAAAARPGIGFSTVYRGLRRLRDLALIAEVVVPGGEATTYEPLGSSHAHFRCTACGALEDVDYALPPRVYRTVARNTGLTVDGGMVTFAGRCRTCGDHAAGVPPPPLN